MNKSIDPQVFVLFGRVLQLFESLGSEYAHMRLLYQLPTLAETTDFDGLEQHKSAMTSRERKSLRRQSAATIDRLKKASPSFLRSSSKTPKLESSRKAYKKAAKQAN